MSWLEDTILPQHIANRLRIKHYRLIVAIAEHGQLSLAASELAQSQPSASRSLGEIEALCGTAIFERHARGMRLTPVGELLASRARNVLEAISEAAGEVSRFRDGLGGTVRIGAVTGAAIGHVVPVVQSLLRSAPAIEMQVDVAMSRELLRELCALRLDFVLARIPPDMHAADFHAVRARGEIVDLFVGQGHPACTPGMSSLAELVDSTWVMQSTGAPIRLAVEAAMLEAGLPLPSRVTNTSSLLVTMAMLAAGPVVAPVSREVGDLLAGLIPATRLCRLAIAEPILVSPYSLLSLRGRQLSPAAQRCHNLIAAALAADASQSVSSRPG